MANPMQVFELLQLVEKIYDQGELDPFISLVQTSNRVLLYLAIHEKVRPSEIGESLRMSRPSVTNYLKALEQDGSLLREINPENRREVYVSLTPKGRDDFQNTVDKLVSLFGDWLGILGPETEHLFNILRISSNPELIGDRFKNYCHDLETDEADDGAEDEG